MVDQADQELPDHRASRVNHRRRFAKSSRLHRANHADQAKPANPAHKDHPAIQAPPANPVTLEKTVNPAAQARRDRPDHPAIPVTTDHEANQAHQPSARQPRPATPDPRVPMDLPDQLVNPVPEVTMVPTAPQDRKDRPAQQAAQARMVPQEIKDHPDRMARKENLVYAPNIALWTAASSSKTAQDAKPEIYFRFGSFLQSRRKNRYGERLLLLAVDPPLLLFTIFYFNK